MPTESKVHGLLKNILLVTFKMSRLNINIKDISGFFCGLPNRVLKNTLGHP